MKCKILFIFFLFFSNSLYSVSIDKNEIEKLQFEILNKNNIGKLEINFIYNKIFDVIEDIEEKKEPLKLIKLDFKYIVDYISDLLERNISYEERNDIWEYLLNNSSTSKKDLLKNRDKILKNL